MSSAVHYTIVDHDFLLMLKNHAVAASVACDILQTYVVAEEKNLQESELARNELEVAPLARTMPKC